MSTRCARKLTVLNRFGICGGPSGLIVKTIHYAGPDTEVTFTKEGQHVSGRSVMGLLTLEGYQGAEILVEARGPRAREVVEALTEIFNAGFFRDEDCLPVPPSHAVFIEPEDREP